MKTLNTLIFTLILAVGAFAQTTTFTYQGRLTDSQSGGSSGSYLMEFRLFAQSSGGTAIDTLTDVPVTVSGNIFTVQLNFNAANAFDGGDKFLEIAVKRSANDTYATLAPRQPITSTPYAIRAKTAELAETSNNALKVGGTLASEIIKEGDSRLSDSRTPLAGSGDYIQNQNAAVQSSTSFRIDGTGAANVFNAQTQFNLGGSRVLSAPGTNNFFVGLNAGNGNTTGYGNSFFGDSAGKANTQANLNSFFGWFAGGSTTLAGNNSFFGAFAGRNNTIGGANSFVGASAGFSNTTGNNNSIVGWSAGINNLAGGDNSFFGMQSGFYNTNGSSNSFFGTNAGFNNKASDNSFVGASAGYGNTTGGENVFVGVNNGNQTTTGSNNSFFGTATGTANTTGGKNTIIGHNANVAAGNLNFAAAFGANAVVSQSDTIVLGKSAGIYNAVQRPADSVQIPGVLQINTLGANGSTALCRNANNQIAACAPGGIAEQNAATAIELREQKARIARQQTQIEAQAEQIKQLKTIVCALKSDAAICREEK